MVGHRRQSKRHNQKSKFCADRPTVSQQVSRKTHKEERLNQWNEDSMKNAIQECKTNPGISYRRIAKKWHVPHTTLFKRTKKENLVFQHLSGRNTILSSDQEAELVDLVKLLSQRGFPLSKPDIQRLAFEFATRNGISGFSSSGHNAAGYVWFKLFMKRHPELRVRKPENLSTARAAGCNETVVMKWFANYKGLAEELGIVDQPDKFWNCDESGLQYQFDQGMVVGEAGKTCYRITPGEKSETTTVLAAFNAAGEFAPPFVIFKGKRIRSEWCAGSPPNTVIKCSDNGWITTDLLVCWAENFLKIIPDDGATRYLILILDGHVTYTYNIKFLEMMKDRHIEVICFPAHTTHLLQAADKSFFRSLKFHWNSCGKTFIRKSGGAHLSKADFFNVFTPAWTEAAKPETAQQDPNSEVPCSVAANNTPLTAELLVLKEPNIAVSRCDNQPMAADNTSPTAEPLAQPELNSEVPCSVAADNTPPMAELLAQQEPNIEVSRCENQPMAANNTTVVAETSAQHDPNSKVPDSEKQPTVVNNTSSALLAPDCEQPTSVACANRRVLIEVQSSNNTKCSFFDLCTIPKRELKPTKRRTVHNFLLTSESHLQFVKDSIERKKPKKSKLKNLSAELGDENCSKKNAKTRKIKGQSDVKSSGKPAKVKSKQKNAGTAKRKVSSKCKKTTEDVDMEEK